MKDSKYVKIISVNSLCLNINKVKRYFEDINGNKNCTLVPTDEGKGKIKKCGDLGSKNWRFN